MPTATSSPIQSDRPPVARAIVVNGEPRTVGAGTLQALLLELGFAGEWLGTAVNGELVTRSERTAHPIREGDRIEVLSPMQGG